MPNNKLISFVRALTLLGLMAGVLSACTSVKPDEKHGGEVNPQPDPVRPCCVNPDRYKTDDPDPALAASSVYFAYDEYRVEEKFKAVVRAHADYLLAHPNRHVFLQGHTDRRGGREYNLALGQKRAQEVLNMLVLLGVPDKNIEAVSFGSERPRKEEDTEAAWAENRRVDFQY